ncbi:hypothetical protein MPL3356_60529 [Mesorhizobium plurifarium]|uniref:Uncharacterized protein n=1 Tax=Mesorhizobium plurifarium TaxID=69974 RepID=A0A090EFL8_MESPL|nr:hypothetical protein MPL3356_60529 [Mesorhizobium plurifarium]
MPTLDREWLKRKIAEDGEEGEIGAGFELFAAPADRAAPGGVLERQFAVLCEKWPGAIITQQRDGSHHLLVPDVEPLKPEQFDRRTTAIAIVIPLGYPQAAPGSFFVRDDFHLSHGGYIPNTLSSKELSHAPLGRGWSRLLMKPDAWAPNSDDLVTAVNLARVWLGASQDRENSRTIFGETE